ncbi:MAG: HAD family hydrolase [Treponema sp.]|nr:HAD family hydrolase [Treponema sp.]
MYTHLFFDLDGTLTDPAPGITNAFIYAYKAFGMEVPPYEQLCTYIGPPLRYTFEKHFGFTGSMIDEGVKKYREYYSEKGLFENSVFPGIEDMLKKLKDKGIKLSVATSKPEHFSIRILEKFGIAKYFDFICGSNMDETRAKKSEIIAYALQQNGNPDPENVLMIGDRLHDVEGAKENGLKCAGVLFGYGTKEELENAGADYLCSSVDELSEFCLFNTARLAK